MKVLVADDDPVSRQLVEASLTRWKYEVALADDGWEALRILQLPNAPKLAVLDWLMPGINGVELCRAIRRNKDNPYTYILLLTGKNTKADIVEGLEAGADDYLTKPFDPQELKVRLHTGSRILALQDRLIAAQEAMRNIALRDGLTGLWNRSAVLDTLSSELNRAQQQRASLGVIMLDIDQFKRINDQYGHLVGDDILRATAKAINNTIRPYDTAGRLGGEEFLVVLPGCDLVNAVSHGERVRMALSRVTVNTPRGEVGITASLGVTVAGHGSYPDVNGIMHAADVALYQAKANGRDRVEFAAAEESPAVAS